MSTEGNNTIDMKHHHGRIKMRERNREKRECNALDATEDANGNDKGSDLCRREVKKANKRKQVCDKSEEAITIIYNSDCKIVHENASKRKPNEKLAPLFVKRYKTDPIVVAARRSFLQSDIVDIVESKSTDRKTNGNMDVLPFPTVSHVTQLEEDKSD